jgi:hypothetical protein
VAAKVTWTEAMMAGKVVGVETCAVHIVLGGPGTARTVMIVVTTDTSQARVTHMQPRRTPTNLLRLRR